jgi:hypothetical protein
MLNALAAALAALSAGCTTAVVGGPRPGPDIPGEAHSELTKADAALLVAKVDAVPESDNAADLAARLRAAAEASLVGNGFSVAGSHPDVVVAMTVRQSAFDKSGNYYLLEGSVPAARAFLPNEGSKVVGVTHIPTVRGERILGFDRASANLGDRLAPAVEKWIADTVRPANLDMAAVTTVIRRTTVFYKSRDPIYVNRFAEKIARLDGVYSCELVAGDATARVWEFRIVYRKSAFPGGLVNKAISVCRDLDIELDR